MGITVTMVEIRVLWLVLRVLTVSKRCTISWSVPNAARPMKNALAVPAQKVVGSLRLKSNLKNLRLLPGLTYYVGLKSILRYILKVQKLKHLITMEDIGRFY